MFNRCFRYLRDLDLSKTIHLLFIIVFTRYNPCRVKNESTADSPKQTNHAVNVSKKSRKYLKTLVEHVTPTGSVRENYAGFTSAGFFRVLI